MRREAYGAIQPKPSGGLRRIERRRISDEVYEQIRAAILDRRFAPGERLSIPDLAKRFDVSQMPVRQAVGRLSDEGLIDVRPRSGTFVARIEAREIEETFDVRLALEQLAAENAVERVEDDDLRVLDDLMKRMDAARDGAGAEDHDRLNSEFHRRIVALSGNGRLIEIYDQLNAHLKIARVHLSSDGWQARVDREQREHRAIVEALRARDARRLAAALEAHIERSKGVLVADASRSAENRKRPAWR